ncbi:MAG: SDR family oxidoreductase [bacterium]|nr:SDR family oxidoreductase [bacterium]
MRYAAVTGSASGIGAAVRARLEKDGFEVIGVDLRDAEVIADLSSPQGRQEAIGRIVERCDGRLDRLVTSAGLSNARPASLIAAVNYFGSVELMDGLFDALHEGMDPAVVAIVSNSAQMAPFEEHPFVLALLAHDEPEAVRIIDELDSPVVAYLGSKHALGRAIRRRVRKWGDARIRLNGVCPGPVRTPLLQATLDDPSTHDSVANIDIPIGRWGEPDDVASLVGFMLGPEGAWIHGSIFYIDGGNDAEIRPDKY